MSKIEEVQKVKEVKILTFPFESQQLIEASAGTGKTWTIAALYVRLVLERNLMPENILVVTFTEAATSELKSRIQKRLLETADYFLDSQENSGDVFLQDLITNYNSEELRVKCAKYLRLASQNIDNAAIYTIHSWCKKILDEYSLYSNGFGEINLLDEASNKQQLFNVIYNYWRNYYVSLQDKNILDFIFNNVWKNPVDLYGKIQHILDIIQISDEFFEKEIISDKDFATKDFFVELAKVKDDINNFYNTFDELLNGLNEVFRKYNAYFKRNSIKKLDDINSFNITENLRKSYNEKDLNKVFDILAELTNKDLLLRGKKLKNNGIPKAEEIAEEFKSKVKFDIENLKKLHIFIIKHAAYTIRKWQKQYKQRDGNLQISFDDLLIYCKDICQNNPKLADILRQKYPVALIDEFQDTDPVQCDIFSTIYNNNDKKNDEKNSTALILIGDPKQAIYSFRGADIFAYLKAKHNISNENHYTLKNNYRSTAEIIDNINTFFDENNHKNNGAFLFKKDDKNPLEFVQVNAKKESEKNYTDTNFPVEFCYINEQLNKDDFIKTAAENCANKIYNLLAENNIKATDCAVLVNNITEANAIQRQLKKLNIPSAYLSEKRSVFATDEAYQLFLCLQAIINPDVKNIRLALATPLLAEQYTNIIDFDSETTNNFLEEKITIFQQYFLYLQQQGIQATIEKLLLDFNCPQRFLNRQNNSINFDNNSISEESGERILTNIRHLAELLQIQSKECYGEVALLNFFANCIVAAKADSNNNFGEFYDANKNNNSDIIFSPISNSEAVNQQGKDASIIRLENDSNLVKIITIHKSKGLEYNYVFLPFLCIAKDEKNFNLPIIYYDYNTENNNYEFVKKCSWNKDDKDIKEIIKENRIKEDIRKLYVALTRAKNNLWILVGNYKSAENSAIYKLLSDFYTENDISKDENYWENIISNLQDKVGKTKLNKTEKIDRISTRNNKNFLENNENNNNNNNSTNFKKAKELKYPARKKFWGQTSYSALIGQNNNYFDEFDFDVNVNVNVNVNENNINANNTTEEDSSLYKFKEELLQKNSNVENYYNFYNSNASSDSDFMLFQNVYIFVQKYIPKGAKVGTFIHSLLETLANKNFITTDKVLNEINLLQKLQSSGITLFKNINSVDDENYKNFVSWLKIICQTPLLSNNFTLPSLEEISKHQLSIRTEIEFILPVNEIKIDELTNIINSMDFIKHLPQNFPRESLKISKINGLLKGFIDLLICYENKYYVLDYKSNYIGDNFADYNATNYEKIILSHRYDVQAALYQLALHRLLKWRLPNYNPKQHLGGTLFYFLRGVNSFSLQNNNSINSGIYHIEANCESIIKMDNLFNSKKKK